jgi:hypothetical protein
MRTATISAREVPLMTAALKRRLNREQMLRRALQEGTAVQRAGRWYVLEADRREPREPATLTATG